PDVAQPVHRRYRRTAAAHHLGRRHRLGRAQPTHDRQDALRSPPLARHEPRGLVPDGPLGADRDRHADLGSRARLSGSAHAARRKGNQVTAPDDKSAAIPAGAPSERRVPTHFVSGAPFDPYSVERLTPEQERYYLAGQWKLMWWKLRRHRIAVISLVVLAILYLMAFLAEPIPPYNPNSRHADYIYAPPQQVRFFHEGDSVGPFVYGLKYELNKDTRKREYPPDTTRVHRIRFFCSGEYYSFWGLFTADFHLICPAGEGTLFLLGTD